jgi:transglutaminase-like putative cysteine protease
MLIKRGERHLLKSRIYPTPCSATCCPVATASRTVFIRWRAKSRQALAPGYDQVAAIVRWLRDTINYRPGSSEIPVSAAEVNSRQVGVCRDLAHLGIALCRSLSIPARMVVGYLHQLEPMDLHAWFEAYVGGRWYTFDATQADLKGGYVAVGYGRDAADVAVFNQFGAAVYPTVQTVRVEHIRG